MRLILLYICVFATLILPAQEYYNDAQLRAHLAVEKKLGKRFSMFLANQTRLTKNMTTLNRSAVDLGGTYKISDDIRVSAEVRLIQRLNKYDYYNTRLWYSVSATFRKKVKRWNFMYRNLFQARYRDMNSDDTWMARYYDRNKITVKYEATKRFTFYAGAEAYIPLNNPTWKNIDRLRGFTGVEIATTKNQQLEFYFMFQQRLNNFNWVNNGGGYDNSPYRRDYIYGIAYSFGF
jgi:hypothetical protein